jgi:hypothetical protein
MCILRLRSIVMTRNKRLQVQSRVVFIMNERFNNYNPWWPREDIAFCPSCPCCFADRPRIHTDFSLIPCCDNPWKDTDFTFTVWAVLYMLDVYFLTFRLSLLVFFLIWPKKNICVFTVTCQKNLVSVGINFFFL